LGAHFVDEESKIPIVSRATPGGAPSKGVKC
jgi:hypothetical protein